MSTDLGFVEGARGEQVQVTRFGAGNGRIGFQLTAPYGTAGDGYVTLSRQGIRDLAALIDAEEPPSTAALERRLDAIEKRLEKLEGQSGEMKCLACGNSDYTLEGGCPDRHCQGWRSR